MIPSRNANPTVVIVGGGFCGAATAYHLAEAAAPLRICVVEPRASLGAGLAYSTIDPAHRINVPAAKMTLRTDRPQHFMEWLSRPDGPWLSPGSITLRGDLFPQRHLFGQYVADHLAPHLAGGAVEHIRAQALAAETRGRSVSVRLSDGSSLAADALVIAATHPAPSLPGAFRDVADARALVADPHDSDRIARIAPRDNVLILGAGLTSADVIASLDQRGHTGRITALSRHGLRSRGHGPLQGESAADFATRPAASTTAFLRRLRDAIERDAASGLTWHAALDRCRAQGPQIWAALDSVERRRLLRHLRVFWDAHRFRVAPQVEAVIDRRLKSRSLRYVAGRLSRAAHGADGIAVTWRPRGGGGAETEAFDAVVVATGPAHGALFAKNPFIASLGQAGLVQPDAFGLGLEVDARACAVSLRAARPSGPVFVCGPLARGQVGELMGAPEVTAHAELAAREILLWADRLARGLARVS